MINIEQLTEEDKGRWVIYTDSLGKQEFGRLKSWNSVNCFVVFNCDARWDEYHLFTGQSCNPADLKFYLRRALIEEFPNGMIIDENGEIREK